MYIYLWFRRGVIYKVDGSGSRVFLNVIICNYPMVNYGYLLKMYKYELNYVSREYDGYPLVDL